ncbi:MAG: hypothetical protein OEQ39_17940 [Gammaproteobacteria bacterium]|nr:hypothetical protein [Gammaproteobacteria bacterium]MDH3467243.1 hypothetical protein [Gammaproteobacteria bacterium]
MFTASFGYSEVKGLRGRLAMILIGVTFALPVSAASHASLTIRVQSSTPNYEDPSTFNFSVIIQNQGRAAFVVLPQALRRVYTAVGSGSAEYSPYPGPPIHPWKGAFALQPDESRVLTFVGMRDGDGVWKIEPGRYELGVTLSVSGDSAKAAEAQVAQFGATVWQGNIESAAIPVTYMPGSRAHVSDHFQHTAAS